MKTRSLRIAVLVCLIALAQQTGFGDEVIVGTDTSNNRLFSFVTNGTLNNGTLSSSFISLGGGAQGVTYDPVTKRIFATRGATTIAAFNEYDGTAVSGSPFTIPSQLAATVSLRNLRMKADNSGILSAQFNSTDGRVQTLSPTTPSTGSTLYSPALNVQSMYQPSVGGYVYAMDSNGAVTRFDDNGFNATNISIPNKVASNGNYRDIYFINPTTFFLSVYATATSGGVGGVYKFTMNSASDTTANLDTNWGLNGGKAIVSNAVGLAASKDGTWLYVASNFSGPVSSMTSIKLSDATINPLMSNMSGRFNYITVVPEPSSIVLAFLGAVAVMVRAWCKKAV